MRGMRSFIPLNIHSSGVSSYTKDGGKVIREIQNYYSWFENYLASNLNSTDVNFEKYFNNKKDHTYRVRDNIKELAKSLKMDGRSVELCEIIALFHDLGRFKQYIKHGTFDERITGSHAKLSLEVLQEEKLLEKLDYKEKEIITKAIEYHNQISIPEGETDEVKSFCMLIRDADKLDAFYNEIYEFESRKNYLKELSVEKEFSEEIIGSLINRKTADFKFIRYKFDRRLAILACIFDLYFDESLKVFNYKRYLSLLLKDIPNSEKIVKVREICESYVINRVPYLRYESGIGWAEDDVKEYK